VLNTIVSAGIWTPGGVSSDGTSLFAVTGNTDGATYWQDGNGVFKFQAGPVFTNESADYFAPAAWKEYDNNDVDLCGSEPIVVDLPGWWFFATPCCGIKPVSPLWL